MVYHSVSGLGPLHGVPVNIQYQPLGVLDRKRLSARRSNTTYCYDFPLVSTVPLMYYNFGVFVSSLSCFLLQIYREAAQIYIPEEMLLAGIRDVLGTVVGFPVSRY